MDVHNFQSMEIQVYAFSVSAYVKVGNMDRVLFTGFHHWLRFIFSFDKN